MRCNFRTLFKLINIINQTNIHNPGSGCQKLTLAYQNKEGINKTHNKVQYCCLKQNQWQVVELDNMTELQQRIFEDFGGEGC